MNSLVCVTLARKAWLSTSLNWSIATSLIDLIFGKYWKKYDNKVKHV